MAEYHYQWHFVTNIVRGNEGSEELGHNAVFSPRSDVNVCPTVNISTRGSLAYVVTILVSAWIRVDELHYLRTDEFPCATGR